MKLAIFLHFALVVFLLTLGSIPPVSADDQSKPESLLAGRWVAVAEEGAGIRMPKSDVKAMAKTLEIDGTKFVLSWAGKTMRGNLEVLPDEIPGAIDMSGKMPNGPNVVLRGIYDIKDDTLRLCYAIYIVNGEDIDRPKEFETEQGTRHRCVTYQRQKKEK